MGNAFALISAWAKGKNLEVAFITIFSALIFAVFYAVISMNGLVLGNDPAVHLEKAQIFLQTGEISLANLGWTPPLYQILLAMLISFTGINDIGQLIFLVKALAVIMNWLLFLSVYLLASKFFSKKVGAVAAVLLLMSFPMYEVNAFGGYTTVLALAFMLLVLLYTPLATERFGYLLVTFFAAFALVLSHQLATFLAVFMMPPILLYMLIKSKGRHLKVVMALILGGGTAFFLYYFRAMAGYLDVVIKYVFFEIKAYAYQIPSAGFNAFMVNFGFIFFLALSGIVVSYYLFRKQKKPLLFIILMLSFFVPLFFAESYLVGFYMPFQWFIYYLIAPMAILAAVSLVFIADKVSVFYAKNKTLFTRNWVRILSVSIAVLLCLMLVFRSGDIYGKVMEASVFYSRTDIKAQDAGVWLKTNYPENSTVIVTEIPGFWFRAFSGKHVIAQTDPIVQRNEIAESVLDLSYEIEHPQTLVRAYEAKGDIIDENYVSIDHVWNRVSYTAADGDFINFTSDGVVNVYVLSHLNREIVFDEGYPKRMQFRYYNDYILVTQTLLVQNNSYPINVSWTLTPLKSDVYNASLYITSSFDLRFNFEKADIPGLLDWTNPWSKPSFIHEQDGEVDWAVADFFKNDLTDSYIGLYDDRNEVAFALKFSDLPDWGNIGVLASRQIDAVRFQYEFSHVNVNQTVSKSYEYLTFSRNSYPDFQQPSQLLGFFDLEREQFALGSRSYYDYIVDNDIGFIVYDKNQLDTKMVRSKLLELIYSNDRYVIFRIKI